MENLVHTCQKAVTYVNARVDQGFEAVRNTKKEDVQAFFNKVEYKVSHFVGHAKTALGEVVARITPEMIAAGQCLLAIATLTVAPMTFTAFFIAGACYPKQLAVFNATLQNLWDRLDNPEDPSDKTSKIIAGGILAYLALPTIAMAWAGQRLGAMVFPPEAERSAHLHGRPTPAVHNHQKEGI